MISDAAKEWWGKREPREQKLLALLLIVGLGGAVYVGVLEPIVGGYLEAKRHYQAARQDYRWLQDQGSLLSRIRDQTGGTLPVLKPATQLKQDVDDSLKATKIKAKTKLVKRGEVELVEIEVQQAAGVGLMRWMERFVRRGQRINSLKIKADNSRLTGTITVGG